MRATQHKTNNRVIGAPPGWDQKELPCTALAITDTTVEGLPAIASFWQPNEADLKVLNAGGLVVLVVLGQGMPPVILDTIRNE